MRTVLVGPNGERASVTGLSLRGLLLNVDSHRFLISGDQQMNTKNKSLFLVPAFLILMLVGGLPAQTITPLHRFTGSLDGATPLPGLSISSNTLYGTALLGGAFGQGTIFKMAADGTTFKKVRDFSPATTNAFGVFTNSDGINPSGALVISGNTLFGAARDGGSAGAGTVFKLKTDGTAFATLHSFTASNFNALGVLTNSDGLNPSGALILSGNTLYGTAGSGGQSGAGTLFKLNTDGTNFVALRSFTAGQTNSAGVLTNKDGMNPTGGLAISANTLYGTTIAGGTMGFGTVFKINADGKDFSTLHSFSSGRTNDLGFLVNLDGINPVGALVLSGNTLYGAASGGGRWGVGTIYKVNTDGTAFTTIRHFTSPRINPTGVLVNNDGMFPGGTFVLADKTLFGTAVGGGLGGAGTAFKLNTDGSGFRVLHAFTPAATNSTGIFVNSEGVTPAGALILSGNVLYGTAADGGRAGLGTAFKLTTGAVISSSEDVSSSGDITDANSTTGAIETQTTAVTTPITTPPPLTMAWSAGKLVLTWPASSTSFFLESTTNLVSPVVWTVVSPGPTLVNGLNTFTNDFSGAQRFYRLRQ